MISSKFVMDVIEEAILKLRKSLAKKCKIKESAFVLWFDVLRNKLKQHHRSLKPTDLFSNDIFEKQSVTNYLKELHDRFVIVPVDKAANNYAIVCKSFYIQVLMKEPGVVDQHNIAGNAVYQHVQISKEDFFKQQEEANQQLGNCLEEENRYIPLLYWTSKQHKNPYKFRFIAGASRCTNKTISKEVALALKHIKTQFKNYCNVIKKRTGLNFFWSIDNSVELIQKISDVDVAFSIKTFDFSTLYTNLPLKCIYESLERLIIKMYKHSGSHMLMINTYTGKAFWSHGTQYSGYKEYTVDKLLDALKFVLYNTYVQFGDEIFLQIKGIPMGGNASPFIADLYL